MKTIKRTVPDIDTTLANTTKYFNQLEFKGIVEDGNIYNVDQESFATAQNVFVDDDQFVSRNPLQKDISIPKDPALYFGYKLVEYLTIGSNKLLVRQSPTGKYIILLYTDDKTYYELDGITNYHISTIEHYIICFNDLGAQVFDTTNPGWQDLATSDLIEIPVVKRVVGSEVKTYGENEFTKSYKEEYVWLNTSRPELPKNIVEAEVKTITDNEGLEYSMTNLSPLSDYGIIKSLNIKVSSNELVTVAKGRICVANSQYFRYSLNEGKTFIKAYYPDYTGNFLNIASISKDGQYFFFVTSDGVYKYSLSEGKWADVLQITYQAIGLKVSNFKQLTSYLNTNNPNITSARFVNKTKSIIKEYNNTANISANITIDFQQDDCYLTNLNISNPSDAEFLLANNEVVPNTIWAFDRANSFVNDVDMSGNLLDTVNYIKNNNLTNIDFTTNTKIELTGLNNCCKFLTGDIFAFITHKPNFTGNNNETIIYWYGPGLYMGGSDNVLSFSGIGYTNLTNYNLTMNDYNSQFAIDIHSDISTISNLPGTIITSVFQKSNNANLFTIFGIDEWNGRMTLQHYELVNFPYINIKSSSYINEGLEQAFAKDNLNKNIVLYAVIYKWDEPEFKNYEATITIGRLYENNNWSNGGKLVLNNQIKNYNGQGAHGLLKPMLGGYINQLTVVSDYDGQWNALTLPQFIGTDIQLTDEDYWYSINDGNIYTNRLSDSDSALITYTYIDNTKFIKVPNVSYSDTELYLAFGDTLQITENSRTTENGISKIQFNLPVKNNQSFIDDITAMINISTTDVALFFKNKVVLCSKVEDETLGYRYDYYNTKLSLGVRLGDSVINTLEGSYTVFPTIRGLAVMNYQAFMATTDQTVEYLTDDVRQLWTDFYKDTQVIKIIQWRNHLILTNDTKDILLYNLIQKTWWRWRVPFNILNAITNQIDLKVITRGELCVFTNKYVINNQIKNLKYYDFSANGENITIDWYIQSQPLHMKAPNYYKNLKQLVFQLFTEDEDKESNTITAQIKLYRKRITLRDPEIVAFQIEKLRTFVKRFNYWKINEVQWGLANDNQTNNPAKFKLNGISIKYELGEEVR